MRTDGFDPWPALYFAEDFETAYREKFQLVRGQNVSGLSPEDLALQRHDGLTDVVVHGRIESVFDLRNRTTLDEFVRVIAEFKVPPQALKLARQLGIPAREVSHIRSTHNLLRAVLEQNWRVWPVQFGLPSQSQILGRLLMDAGFEAIAYPSTKNGTCCVAALPYNFTAGGSYIEVAGVYPQGVAHPRLDAGTYLALMQPT